MDEIFTFESLAKLEAFLRSKPAEGTRKALGKLFLENAIYTNAEEWNKAVRLCEALTIVGWGKLEPVEAVRGQGFNGNPYTTFMNRRLEQRFVAAQWSKRKSGLTLQPGDAMYYYSPDLPKRPGKKHAQYAVKECIQDIKLETQRNWIVKCPIRVHQMILNCYPQSEDLRESIKCDLFSALDDKMGSTDYGRAIDYIWLKYSLSDRQTNYVILEEDVRLSSQELFKRLKKMHSVKEIEANRYFLTPRYEFGNFNKEQGTIKVGINFPREFSMQSTADQKREFAHHLIAAIDKTIVRLNKKKVPYDFDGMRSDFQLVLEDWAAK